MLTPNERRPDAENVEAAENLMAGDRFDTYRTHFFGGDAR